MPGAFRRYEILDRIGVGGMAEVFRAHALGPDEASTLVVVKRILPHLSEDLAYRQMFMDEAKIASTLEHPNIVRLIDLGRMDEQLFLALEYVDGADLQRILRKSRERGTPIPVGTVLYVMICVLHALHYAHARKDPSGRPLRIVHRDVTPQNVLVSRAGEVKVADFGVAKATVRDDRTVAGAIKGNPLYMAPEQVSGASVDPRTDVYAAGAVLLTLLCGRHPFESEPLPRLIDRALAGDLPTPSSLVPGLPRGLDTVVNRATRRDPLHRYPSAAEFATALEQFAALRGIVADGRGIPLLLASLFPPERINLEAPLPPPDQPTSSLLRVAPPLNDPTGEISVFHSYSGERPAAAQSPSAPFAVQQEDEISVTITTPRPTKRVEIDSTLEPGTVVSATISETISNPAAQAVPPVFVDPVELDRTRETLQRVTAPAESSLPIAPTRYAPPPVPPKPAVTATTLVGHRLPVSAVAVAADGVTVISAGHDQTVRVWNLPRREERRVMRGHGAALTSLAITADGSRAVTGSRDRTVRLWDLPTGTEIRSLEGHAGWIFAVDLTEDGKFALSGGADRTLKLWQIDKGKAIASLSGHTDTVSCLSFLDEGLRAVTGSYDKSLRIWSLEEGKELAALPCEDAVRALAVSPDGGRALSAGADLAISLWDLSLRVVIDRFSGHREAVVSVCFSPDGKKALSGSFDGTVKLWDLARRAPVRTFVGHTDPVMSVAFTPDGLSVVSGSADGTIRIWPAL